MAFTQPARPNDACSYWSCSRPIRKELERILGDVVPKIRQPMVILKGQTTAPSMPREGAETGGGETHITMQTEKSGRAEKSMRQRDWVQV